MKRALTLVATVALAGCSVVVDHYSFVDDAGERDAGADAAPSDGGGDGGNDAGVPCVDTRILQVAAGRDHTCIVRACGLVYCWGEGNSGQLGDGLEAQSPYPVLVQGLDDATEIRVGDRFSCALRQGGTVACWGTNRDGQLGDGSTAQRATPVAVSGITDAQSISAGLGSHTCVIHAGGASVSCWGFNQFYNLGDGTTDSQTEPVAVAGLGTATWVEIATGLFHTCARSADSNLLCWGGGGFGALGTNSEDDSPTPVSPTGLTGVTHVAVGGHHMCAGIDDSSVYCWGANSFGELGDGTMTTRMLPVASTTVALGGMALGVNHSCFFDSSGGVLCTGRNDEGQLGLGTMAGADTAQLLSGFSGVVEQMTSGEQHSCVLTASGEVWCWGSNDAGQLGDGTVLDRLQPTQMRER